MKRVSILFFLFFLAFQGFGWGFWAHQRINRMSIFTLPPEMLVLYKANIQYITEHAVDPDKRRYAVDGEAARHYIDIDHYGEYPYENVPRRWNDAVEKFGKDSLEAYGILPYHLPREMYRLTKAFKDGDLKRILKVSADVGHYIGDAHVPLHTTKNYNGQLTGQKGIHGLWESRIPELFGEEYSFFVGKAYYMEDVVEASWQAVLESNLAKDSVLLFEKSLSERFPEDKKYGYESRNNIVVRAYSRDFVTAYHDTLSGMVERRMRASILRIGSFWYTAWKNAGSPDLKPLVTQKVKIKKKKLKRRLKIIDREASSFLFFKMSAPFPIVWGWWFLFVDC